MAIEMAFDLAFRFSQKPKIPGITGLSRHNPQRQRPRIPQRIQKAFTPAQLLNSPFGPRKVLRLFPSRMLQRPLDHHILRCQCLPLIQGLGAYFTTVIDPHQRRGMTPLFRRQFRQGHIRSWHRTASRRRGKYCAKRLIKLDNQAINAHSAAQNKQLAGSIRMAPQPKSRHTFLCIAKGNTARAEIIPKQSSMVCIYRPTRDARPCASTSLYPCPIGAPHRIQSTLRR